MTKVMNDALDGGHGDNASNCDDDDYNNDNDNGSNDDGNLHLLIIITISMISIVIIIFSSFVFFIDLFNYQPRYIYMDIKKVWLNIFMECKEYYFKTTVYYTMGIDQWITK